MTLVQVAGTAVGRPPDIELDVHNGGPVVMLVVNYDTGIR